ncbi:MAG: RIP metalloprotease RseP, partial [Bdellovibrionales bacterium]|nr:RIP metalloprotease RseP [Bdellovibrionales bacterium]
MSGVGPAIILLGLLIFVHELGHFLVAKACGVRVEVFSLGFGKKILSYVYGDTTYCISIVPLGGYVKMYGDDPTASVPEDQKKWAFLHKPVSQRIAIVLAGPLMNLAFAFPLFLGIGYSGEELASNQLGEIAIASPAYKYGFRSGDKIVSINNEEIKYWKEIQKKLE